MQSDILVGMNKIAMIEAMKGKTTKLVMPAKDPGWTKEMKLDVYLKALEVWMEMNKDVSEGVRFQYVIVIKDERNRWFSKICRRAYTY